MVSGHRIVTQRTNFKNQTTCPYCAMKWPYVSAIQFQVYLQSHLSPGVSLIYDLSNDGGILQSELFTSRSRNLVLAKLPNLGFWRYGQFFKWNRVKMAKNGLKMVEIFWGASYMINDNIFNIFCFSTFSFGYFTNPVFWPNLEKIALKTRFRKYSKEIVEK